MLLDTIGMFENISTESMDSLRVAVDSVAMALGEVSGNIGNLTASSPNWVDVMIAIGTIGAAVVAVVIAMVNNNQHNTEVEKVNQRHFKEVELACVEKELDEVKQALYNLCITSNEINYYAIYFRVNLQKEGDFETYKREIVQLRRKLDDIYNQYNMCAELYNLSRTAQWSNRQGIVDVNKKIYIEDCKKKMGEYLFHLESLNYVFDDIKKGESHKIILPKCKGIDERSPFLKECNEIDKENLSFTKYCVDKNFDLLKMRNNIGTYLKPISDNIDNIHQQVFNYANALMKFEHNKRKVAYEELKKV